MLEELLIDVTRRIAHLSSNDSSLFAEQMSKAGANFQDADESIRSALLLGVASFTIERIKEIPALAQEIVAESQKPENRPEVRCSLLASLLYLVQPQDLIPDDAPGGYGFLDDCVLLHAARLAHLTQFPNPDAKAEALHKNLNSFSMCIGPKDRDRFQQAIDGVVASVYAFRQLEPEVLSFIEQQMIENPLAYSLPASKEHEPIYSLPKSPPKAHRDGETLIITTNGGGIAHDGRNIFVLG